MRGCAHLALAASIGSLIGFAVGSIVTDAQTRESRSPTKTPTHLSVRVCRLEDLDTGEYDEPPRGTVVLLLENGRDAPPGWVECKGQDITEEQYPDLFADVGLEGARVMNLPSIPRVHIMGVAPPAPMYGTMPYLMFLQQKTEPFLWWQRLRMLIRVD